jgi:2-polyprenyl-3-methyl-5-hydroxy-6-metoxy-1,4-benzoquinol methylase
MQNDWVQEFVRQVLQQKPVYLLDLQHDWDDQSAEQVMLETRRLTNKRYRIQVLKKLLQIYNYEPIYEEIATLFANVGENDCSNKIYFLPASLESIEIFEDRAIVSQGTTGLSTWAASLYLLEYLSAVDLDRNVKVLELGSGAGLLAIALKKMEFQNVTASDCNALVLERLSSNVALNAVDITIKELDWESHCQLEQYDLVIGADVGYDPILIQPLLSTVHELLQFSKAQNRETTCLISLTHRNPETLELFLSTAREKRINLQTIQFSRKWYYYPENSEIFLYQLYL